MSGKKLKILQTKLIKKQKADKKFVKISIFLINIFNI